MNTERIERIITRLKEKETTHPNLSILWLTYLDNKLCSLEKTLLDCERVLDDESEDDPDIQTIATMYLLCRALTENRT